MTTLSIIVPVLNEADGIAPALAALAPLRQRGVEVIVADGGSTDGTIANATPLCDRVVSAPRGRAMQMNAGAAVAAGGFPEIPLMEDIEFSRRLKHVSPPLCLRARVRTSGRRWDTHGLWFTIFLMWRLRLSYFLGASPETLAQVYGYGRRKD